MKVKEFLAIVDAMEERQDILKTIQQHNIIKAILREMWFIKVND